MSFFDLTENGWVVEEKDGESRIFKNIMVAGIEGKYIFFYLCKGLENRGKTYIINKIFGG